MLRRQKENLKTNKKIGKRKRRERYYFRKISRYAMI